MNYLNEYSYVIDLQEKVVKNIRKRIYSHRYFGIALYHFKAHKFLYGINALINGFVCAPFIFLKHLCKYVILKLFKIKKDYKKVV